MNSRIRTAVAVPLLAVAVLTGFAQESSAAVTTGPRIIPAATVAAARTTSTSGSQLSATSIALPRRLAS